MSLIKKANELTIQTKIKALIYGQAGTGKTTLALSSPKPLLFDFDNGVHRVNFAHLQDVDTVQIRSYQDFLDVLANENLTPYETFVIDTGGKMLDFMGEYIIKNNPKMGKANGMLTLQGFGERKMMFSALVKRISIMNKHVVFVAHRETKTEGDDTRYIPQFGGTNYDNLVTELDLVGYVEAQGRERTITFDPTSRNDGKNSCNLPPLFKIPTIIDEQGNPIAPNDFFTTHVIEAYNARLEQHRKANEAYQKLIKEIDDNIAVITDIDSLNETAQRIQEWQHIGNSKVVAGRKLNEKAATLNAKFNKESKQYEAV